MRSSRTKLPGLESHWSSVLRSWSDCTDLHCGGETRETHTKREGEKERGQQIEGDGTEKTGQCAGKGMYGR
jgi:hypothetical protein